MKKCSVDGCGNTPNGRYCTTHSERLRLHGDLHHRRPTPEERFWGKVDKTDGCWLWTAGTNINGYGRLSVNRIAILAHRYSWALHNGEIPKGMCVMHKCDNPPCVNPDHLEMGSQQDNLKDMLSKGRHGKRGKDKKKRKIR